MGALQLLDLDGQGNTYGLTITTAADQAATVAFNAWTGGHTPESAPDKTTEYKVSGALVEGGVFKGSTLITWMWVPEPAKIAIAPAVAGMTPGYTISVSPDVPLAPGGSAKFVKTSMSDWQILVAFFKGGGSGLPTS